MPGRGGNPRGTGDEPMNHTIRMSLIGALVLSCLGCSLAVKGGLHRFDNESLQQRRASSTVDVWELELGIREFKEGRVGLDFAIDLVEPPTGADFQDVRLTSRYRWRSAKRVSPFAGGGVGWYRWTSRRSVLVPEPFCFPDVFLGRTCIASQEQTISDGFYPHASAGFDVRITNVFDFVVEDRFDFAKDDQSVDFGSNQLMVGFRFQLQR